MDAPDKIYLHKIRDEEKSGYYRDWFEERARCVPSVEYIRKDALLEWAKELKGQVCSLHPNNRDATCARDGMLTIIDNLFDKLNSI